jgi:excisionase family DNA binding protein
MSDDIENDTKRTIENTTTGTGEEKGDDIERIFSGEPLKGRGRRALETAGEPATDDEVRLDQTEWLSTQDAAARLGITPRTLYRFIDQGDLPAYRFGRVIRLRAHEVERFVENSRITPGELVHLYPDPVAREDHT